MSTESGNTTPLTFSLDIHHISQIPDYIERQNYVLNLFDKMNDADIDLEDYYGMMTTADAYANSLVDSPEPQPYLSQVNVTDDVTLSQEIVEHRAYAQAVYPSNTFHREWQFAVEKELNSLTENNKWTLVPMPSDMHIIGCLWIFKLKRDSSGRILKFKARVCARGDQDTYEIDYSETFAPTLRYTTLRVLQSIACSFDLEIEQFDVVIAFLKAHVDYDIYMCSPHGLKVISPNGVKLVCKFNKSLYGVKQAPRSWQSLLSSWLVSCGFRQSKTDPSLYTMIHDGHLFALAVYVDDCLLIGKQSKMLTLLRHDFSSRFKIEDLGPAAWILGCNIIRNRSRVTFYLVQNQYLNDVLQKFGMSECTQLSTPMSTNPSKSVTTAIC